MKKKTDEAMSFCEMKKRNFVRKTLRERGMKK